MTGKQCNTWWKKDASKLVGRICFSNVIKFTLGPNGPTLNAYTPADFWEVFITSKIIKLLVNHTNLIISEQKEKYGQSFGIKDTDAFEMKALIGFANVSWYVSHQQVAPC